MISLFTSADEQLKTRSAELFFIIAKQDADRFISITGYGNGAGLLYDAGMFSHDFRFRDDFYSDRMSHHRISGSQLGIPRYMMFLRYFNCARSKPKTGYRIF